MLDIDPGRQGPPPRRAATVVLLRDASAGPEVFLVRRARSAAFMGGAYVFPGGAIEPGDSDPALLARVRGVDPAAAAHALGEALDPPTALGIFVAALRETFEEAGVLFGSSARGAVDLREARRRLASGTSLRALAEELALELDAGALVPFARWVTPAVEQRRYDAHFFLAVAPSGCEHAVHDEAETVSSTWKRPADAVAEHLAGRIDLPPPTLRTLEELAGHARAADAIAAARARRPPLVRPVFRDLDGVWVLALPGDPEHPEREAVVPGPTRFTLRNGRFVSG
jgi:8-oxo-dGTP pyrophosphatase MutT (NUDIX family)